MKTKLAHSSLLALACATLLSGCASDGCWFPDREAWHREPPRYGGSMVIYTSRGSPGGSFSVEEFRKARERIPRQTDALCALEPQGKDVPLTPALSPSEGERGNRRQISGEARFRGR